MSGGVTQQDSKPCKTFRRLQCLAGCLQPAIHLLPNPFSNSTTEISSLRSPVRGPGRSPARCSRFQAVSLSHYSTLSELDACRRLVDDSVDRFCGPCVDCGMGKPQAADRAQLLNGLEGDHGHGARAVEWRQNGHVDGWSSDVEECECASGQVRAPTLLPENA